MPSLKDIRLRIKSVQTTQQTTKAMKMVSASKLRRAQDNIIQLRPYAAKLNSIMQNISDGIDESVTSPFMEVREVKNVLLVCITSNRGLCGAFNTSVIRLAQAMIDEKYAAQSKSGNLHLLCLGKKSFEYFNRRGYHVINENYDVFSKISFAGVEEMALMAMNGYADGTYDKVEIIYNAFKNVATQVRTEEEILPVRLNKPAGDTTKKTDFAFEPDKKTIIEELIPQILKMQFYRAVLESNASEHGARMVAMDKATENANDLIKELKLSYNRARQSAITKEILEIVGGAEALNG